jgi:hypothetical protein
VDFGILKMLVFWLPIVGLIVWQIRSVGRELANNDKNEGRDE